MLDSTPRPEKRQRSPVPALFSRQQETTDLIQAVIDDTDSSPHERARTLGEIWGRLGKEHPQVKRPDVVSTIAHQIAELNEQDPAIQATPAVLALLDEIASQAVEQQRLFNPRDIAGTARAFATLGLSNKPLLRALGQEAANQSPRFNPGEIASTAWAFATLGFRDARLFGTLAQEAAKQCRHFKPEELADIAWACATLRFRDKQLFTALAQEVANQCTLFSPQDLLKTIRAFSTLRYNDRPLFGAFAREAAKQIHHFLPRDLAHTAQRFAALGMHDKELFGALGREAAKKCQLFEPQELSNTAWAFATVRFRDEHLFGALAEAAGQHCPKFTPRDLAQTAWSFAALGIPHNQLFAALAREAVKRHTHFSSQDLANTAWAFAVDYPELISNVIDRSILDQSSIDDIDWLQCYQALLVAGQVLPSETLPRYRRIIEQRSGEEMNRFERSVKRELGKVLRGIPFSLSHAYVIGGVATDFLLHFDERRIIVECDGDRFHLSHGPDGGQPLGRDRLQDKLFKLFGFEVVHIRDSEWISHNRASLLRSKLGL